MEKQNEPLEAARAVDSSRPRSRGMLGRIRQASGNFDFSALTGGGRRRDARTSGSASAPDSADVVPYNPLYVPEEGDSVPPISALWKQPDQPAPGPDLNPIPEWERAKPRPKPSARPIPSIYESIEDADQYIPMPRARRRRRERVPFARAALTRLMLCIWTLLFGASLGVGAGPIVESTTHYRALPTFGRAAPTSAQVTARSAKASTSNRRARRTRQAPKPAAAKRPSQPAQQTQDPWSDYRTPLTVPLIAILVISLLWVFGAPNLLGDYDMAGYRTAAFLVFAHSIWCGLAGIMTTLELRSSTPTSTKTAVVIPRDRRESFG